MSKYGSAAPADHHPPQQPPDRPTPARSPGRIAVGRWHRDIPAPPAGSMIARWPAAGCVQPAGPQHEQHHSQQRKHRPGQRHVLQAHRPAHPAAHIQQIRPRCRRVRFGLVALVGRTVHCRPLVAYRPQRSVRRQRSSDAASPQPNRHGDRRHRQPQADLDHGLIRKHRPTDPPDHRPAQHRLGGR